MKIALSHAIAAARFAFLLWPQWGQVLQLGWLPMALTEISIGRVPQVPPLGPGKAGNEWLGGHPRRAFVFAASVGVTAGSPTQHPQSAPLLPLGGRRERGRWKLRGEWRPPGQRDWPLPALRRERRERTRRPDCPRHRAARECDRVPHPCRRSPLRLAARVGWSTLPRRRAARVTIIPHEIGHYSRFLRSIPNCWHFL
jgi:hypothetical protein